MINEVVKAAKGHNRYCGPGAISALTGMDTAQSAYLIRKVSGMRAVRGTATRHMIDALHQCGIYAERRHTFRGQKPTLNQFWNNTYNGQLVLVACGQHWVVMYDDYIVDNQQGLVKFSASKHKRKRMESVTYLKRGPAVDKMVEVIKANHAGQAVKTNSRNSRVNKARNACRQLAAKHDIVIDREWSDCRDLTLWVSPGKSWLSDPREDEHYAYDWEEALDIVQWYANYHGPHQPNQW